MEIKPLANVSSKWGRNAAAAGSSYKDGVNAPRRSWAAAAAAADESRKAGLAAADARGAFVNGVNAAGDAKWKNNAFKIGASRYPQGVQNAQPDFQQGFAPYHAVISGTTLPPRGPKGSPENLQRVAVIAQALHDAKTAS